MIYAIDAGPMIAFLKGEPGELVIAGLLADTANQCYAHFFNLCEVYYQYFRRGGASLADSVIQDLLDAGIMPRDDHDTAFWKDAGFFKGSHPLALGDAFCLALARRIGGTIVTTDHTELDPLVPLGYCPILFIR